MTSIPIGYARLEALVTYMRDLPDAMGSIPESVHRPGWIDGTFRIHDESDAVWATLEFDHESEEWYATFPTKETA